MLTLLTNADVYAPERLGLRHLLIGGERILWIGETRPVLPADLGVVEVDIGGQRLIPGLIDGHCHLTGGGGEAGPGTKVPPPPLTAYTLGGVTSVVGVLGTDDITRTPAELVAAARGLEAEGLSAWCHTGGYHVPVVTLAGSVRADIVHIDKIIGVGEVAISDHRSSQPTYEELIKLAAEAHVAGLITGKAGILHLHVGDGERGLAFIRGALGHSELPPRVFNPTHVNRRRALFDEAIALARVGCTVDITAFPVAEGEDAWSADEALVRYLASGAPAERVTVSSDGGGCLPTFDTEGRVVHMDVGASTALAGTLRALLERGEALERVLPAFTSNVAGVLRLGRKGRVGVGMDADLVVLDRVGCVADVMARGVWMVREARTMVTGMFQ